MFADLLLDPLPWAAHHFGGVDLGDGRRDGRAVKIAAAVAAAPGASLPKQMGDAHQAKAAYRFLDTPDHVTFASLAGGHWAATRAGAASAGGVVLLLGDTTTVDYSGHRGVAGLGPIGNGGGRGMDLHSVLAVDPARGGQLQGVAWQDLFYRPERQPAAGPEPNGKGKGKKPPAEAVAKADRQSRVWADAVAGCGRPAAGTRFVHVTDSGSDDFGHFAACRDHGVDFLARLYRPRRAALGHDDGAAAAAAAAAAAGDQSVLDLARALPALGGKTVGLRGRKRQKKKVKVQGKGERSTVLRDVPARTAKLLVSAAAVTLFPPAGGGYGADPLRLWVTRVWEPNPPAGVEPIEWVLLTSVPVTSLEDALRTAEWYGHRWLIEEYHKCLKTGCRIEQRQLGTADRLEALLGILVVVAARLLALKQQAADRPDTPAADAVGDLTVAVLVAKRKLKAPPGELTVYQFCREVAKLGGFMGRRGDGEPGWQTLWLGWAELQTLVEGARLMSTLGRGT